MNLFDMEQQFWCRTLNFFNVSGTVIDRLDFARDESKYILFAAVWLQFRVASSLCIFYILYAAAMLH